MEVKLIVSDGPRAGLKIAVSVDEFVIGRGSECHLRPGGEQVSQRHCAVVIEGRQVTLRDFGSKNGTLVNDERVEGSRVLEKGDRLQVGNLRFVVDLIDSLGGKKRPKVKDVHEAAARTAAAGQAKPLDIDRWLDDDEDDQESVPLPEPTAKRAAKQADSTKASLAEKARQEKKAAAKDAEKKKTPPKPVSDLTDSQAAAEAMIRKMMRGS